MQVLQPKKSHYKKNIKIYKSAFNNKINAAIHCFLLDI